MPALLFLARLLLGGVFALAGTAKLADLAGSRKALAAFGVPASLAGPLGLLLPLFELAVAMALVLRSTAAYGAAGALVLLLLFVAGISISLARGRHPDCHCFGQLHSEPVGWPVLTRNAVLTAIAAFVLIGGWADPGPSAVAWLLLLSEWQLAVVLGGALALAGLGAQTALLLRLVGQNAQILQRLALPVAAPSVDTTAASPTVASPATTPSGLTLTASSPAQASLLSVLTMTAPSAAAPAPAAPAPGRRIGSPAPSFSLPNLLGQQVSVDTLRDYGKPAVVFFSDPECASCVALLPEIAQWRWANGHGFTVAFISRGTVEANLEKFGEQPPELVLLQKDREVAGVYGIAATPSAVVLGADGTISSQTALGDVQIRQLMDSLARTPPPEIEGNLAAAADFELPELEGGVVGLAQLVGHPSLLLFWNPTCPHCEGMLGDLKAWEDLPQTKRPRLLVISTGTADLARAQGFRSAVALDSGFTVGPRYGVEGTPSAVLIDREGRRVGAPAVGAFEIFAMVERAGLLDAGAPDDLAATGAEAVPAPLAVFPADATPIQQSCTQDELLSDGGIILYSGCRQQVTTLNATGAYVWECCDGEHDLEAITAELREVFPAVEGLDRDVRAILDQLFQAGMIGTAGTPATTTPAETSVSAV